MTGSRIDTLRALVQANPGDVRARFFLASELFRAAEWQAAAEAFEAYLASGPADPGSARKSLGICYDRLGRDAEAIAAFRRAEREALEYGHAALAEEVRELLDDLER